jgi:hypothetical protein
MFKVDVFVMRGDSYSRGEMQRGIVASVVTSSGPHSGCDGFARSRSPRT